MKQFVVQVPGEEKAQLISADNISVGDHQVLYLSKTKDKGGWETVAVFHQWNWAQEVRGESSEPGRHMAELGD